MDDLAILATKATVLRVKSASLAAKLGLGALGVGGLGLGAYFGGKALFGGKPAETAQSLARPPEAPPELEDEPPPRPKSLYDRLRSFAARQASRPLTGAASRFHDTWYGGRR